MHQKFSVVGNEVVDLIRAKRKPSLAFVQILIAFFFLILRNPVSQINTFFSPCLPTALAGAKAKTGKRNTNQTLTRKTTAKKKKWRQITSGRHSSEIHVVGVNLTLSSETLCQKFGVSSWQFACHRTARLNYQEIESYSHCGFLAELHFIQSFFFFFFVKFTLSLQGHFSFFLSNVK